jgi:cell wall assembly regulator SMI1
MQGKWSALIEALPGTTILAAAATASDLRGAERKLGAPLPTELAALVAETNGVEGEYGLGLVWPLDRLVEENLALRANADLARLYMPFDPLLFFAEAGNGDLFALVPHTGNPDVYTWNHENDSRTWVAPSLGKYLEWWLNGRISL